MAITRKEEARALNTEEKELVEKSHHPLLQDVPGRFASKSVGSGHGDAPYQRRS